MEAAQRRRLAAACAFLMATGGHVAAVRAGVVVEINMGATPLAAKIEEIAKHPGTAAHQKEVRTGKMSEQAKRMPLRGVLIEPALLETMKGLLMGAVMDKLKGTAAAGMLPRHIAPSFPDE